MKHDDLLPPADKNVSYMISNLNTVLYPEVENKIHSVNRNNLFINHVDEKKKKKSEKLQFPNKLFLWSTRLEKMRTAPKSFHKQQKQTNLFQTAKSCRRIKPRRLTEETPDEGNLFI